MKTLILLILVLSSFNSLASDITQKDIDALSPKFIAQYNAYCYQSALMAGKSSFTRVQHLTNANKLLSNGEIGSLSDGIEGYILKTINKHNWNLSTRQKIQASAIKYYNRNCPLLNV